MVKIPKGYEFIKPLAKGGFKEVFKVRDTLTGQNVALKRYKRISLDQLSSMALKEGTTIEGLFKRDAMQTVLNHPNILRSSWFYDDNGDFWIREELFVQTLAQMRGSQGRPTTAKIFEYAHMLADVLRYCHERNTVHADIKMDNIGFRGETLFLCDFGLATIFSPEQRYRFAPGSIQTRAPELCGEHVRPTPLSDIWALGCVLYALDTGHYPFLRYGERIPDLSAGGKREKFEQEKMRLIRSSRDTIDDVLEETNPIVRDIISSCLRYDERDRCSASDLIEIINRSQATYLAFKGIKNGNEALCNALYDGETAIATRRYYHGTGEVHVGIWCKSLAGFFNLNMESTPLKMTSEQDLKLFTFYDQESKSVEGDIFTQFKVKLSNYGRALIDEESSSRN